VKHYVVCLDLRGRSCLVVGGGRVAREKAQGLLECAAEVTVIAPEIDDEVAATNDRLVNARVSSAAHERDVPCNVADDPELCSFILPAIVRRDPITIAVSTGGASPALAQRLRDDIGDLVGTKHAELADRLAELRPWAKREFSTYAERRDYFQRLVEEALA
jgi:siroheme synthase-like protein